MKTAVNFLEQLSHNNNKEWFDANRKFYAQAKEEFHAFTGRLIEGINEFDDTIGNLAIKDCVFRINRDIRFSANKAPYKTHFGAFVSPHGKNSGYMGYYFHIEAPNQNYIGGNILASGGYMQTPKELESIRTEIYDNPQGFIKTLKEAEPMKLMEDDKMKRPPKGFPADFEYIDYLMHRSYSLWLPLSAERVIAPDILEYSLDMFRRSKSFVRSMNRAIEFAKTDM
jgi:uncharacterized protein (TIGR02453 family)